MCAHRGPILFQIFRVDRMNDSINSAFIVPNMTVRKFIAEGNPPKFCFWLFHFLEVAKEIREMKVLRHFHL